MKSYARPEHDASQSESGRQWCNENATPGIPVRALCDVTAVRESTESPMSR